MHAFEPLPLRSLKAEDRPSPVALPDPESAGLDLMAVLRDLARDARYLLEVANTAGLPPKVLHMIVDNAHTTGRALDAGETMRKAQRQHRAFASDVGV